MNRDLQTLREWLRESQRIAVLSGAGMSTESGLPDFRSAHGIWENRRVTELLSAASLRHKPEQFWDFFKEIFLTPDFRNAKPNAGHIALAELERRGTNVSIFTQNVDGLHQAAGSQSVWELHGNLQYVYCPSCGTEYTMEHALLDSVPICHGWSVKRNSCEEVLQPNVVLFEQSIRHMDDALRGVLSCDLLLILGTSLTVEPVSSLPDVARQASRRTVLINLTETDFDPYADLVLHARVGETLAQVLE